MLLTATNITTKLQAFSGSGESDKLNITLMYFRSNVATYTGRSNILYLKLNENQANKTVIYFIENATKYSGIVHQQDVWHGAKNVTKRVIDVSTGIL